MIVFATITLGDCEDPEIYAAGPILDWQKTEQGTWVMEHATEVPSFSILPCPDTWGYKIRIYGTLKEEDEIFYRLKFA